MLATKFIQKQIRLFLRNELSQCQTAEWQSQQSRIQRFQQAMETSITEFCQSGIHQGSILKNSTRRFSTVGTTNARSR